MKKILAWLLEPFYFKVLLPYMGACGFILYGGKGGADAPDYTPVAQASEKAAQIAADLGKDQLAEAKRQYDNNVAIAKPVAQAQLGLMNQSQAQGDDYFNYMKSYSRPVEQQLYYEAMGFTPEEVAQIENSRQTESAAFKAQQGLTQQQSAIPTTIDVPTYTQDIPAGAVKGSELPANANIGTGLDVTHTNFFGLTDSPLYSKYTVSGKADPNAYYVKNADGSYSSVSPQLKEGTKTITINGVPTQVSSGVTQTPETDALTAKLGATASARLAAADAAERGGINDINTELANRIGETDAQVYERNKAGIDAETDQAAADARNGYTNAINIAARQGMRYGFSPAKLAAAAGAQSTQQATQQAAAVNGTRKNAVQTMYQRGIGSQSQKLTGANTLRANRIQDTAIQTAKKQDVAGLYRNLTGASQGSYGLAINAGNSAVQNNAQAGNSLLQANQGAANTILQGQQTKLSGLTGILNAQTSQANANAGSGDAIWGALGSVGGAMIAASDKNIKKDIKPIDDEAALDGIKKTKISKWKYDADKVQDAELVDDKEHIGGMAQDLQKNLGNQVSNGKMVDLISAVGVNMAATKALAKKVDQLSTSKRSK